jgi:PKD repeat protein
MIFVGCGTTTTTSNPPQIDSYKIAKTNVDISLDKQTLQVGLDDGVEIHANSNTNLHAYQWFINGTPVSESADLYMPTPTKAGSYTITLKVKDANDQLITKEVTIHVTQPEEKPLPVIKPDRSFSSIQSLIAASKDGTFSDVRYICYGDSTRSVSEYENQYVFEYVKSTLSQYHVTSINKSITGILARDAANASFLYGGREASWVSIVNSIEGDGIHTIVDISIGLNDYGEYSNDQIKDFIRTVITSIRNKKPYTHFILTVPSRTYYDRENMSNGLISIYRELSNELSIPMINVPRDAMPLDELTLDWYRSGDQTHLTRESQRKIANLILSKILP